MKLLAVFALTLLLGPFAVGAQELQPLPDYEKERSIDEARRLREQLTEIVDELGQQIEEVSNAEAGKRNRNSGQRGKIVNGTLTASYPAVGALIKGSSADSAGSWCTGTLIGCRTFLTAAHCVDDATTHPERFHVFLQHGGIFAVNAIEMHPDYSFPKADLAVIRLATAVDGIRPERVNQSATPQHGTEGTIVGFGRSGGSADDYGLKRVGRIRTAECTRNLPLVCWDFAGPIGLPGEDSNTCNADSGGPLFVEGDAGGAMHLAGVTSGGTRATCLPDDHSYDVDVFHYREWIEQTAGADFQPARCGELPEWDEEKVRVAAASGVLGPGATSMRYRLQVPPGLAKLRVAMNAVDDGVANFDLYVKRQSPPATDDADCSAAGPGQYGFCELDSPAAGEWFLLINRKSGEGQFQIVATLYEEAP